MNSIQQQNNIVCKSGLLEFNGSNSILYLNPAINSIANTQLPSLTRDLEFRKKCQYVALTALALSGALVVTSLFYAAPIFIGVGVLGIAAATASFVYNKTLNKETEKWINIGSHIVIKDFDKGYDLLQDQLLPGVKDICLKKAKGESRISYPDLYKPMAWKTAHHSLDIDCKNRLNGEAQVLTVWKTLQLSNEYNNAKDTAEKEKIKNQFLKEAALLRSTWTNNRGIMADILRTYFGSNHEKLLEYTHSFDFDDSLSGSDVTARFNAMNNHSLSVKLTV